MERTAKREIVKKPLGWFKKVKNARQDYGEAELPELGKSLLMRQLYPVVCRPDGTLLDGHRRHAAAELVGKPDLDVIILDEDLTPGEITALQLIAATQCKRLTGHEVFLGAKEFAQLNAGRPLQEIADMLAMKPANLSKILTAAKLEPEAMQAFAEGKLTASDAYLIGRLDDRAEQLALLEARLNGANRESMIRRDRQKKNGDQPKVSRFKANISGAAFTVTREGLDIGGLIEAISELMKLAKKAERDRLDVKTFEAVLRNQSKS